MQIEAFSQGKKFGQPELNEDSLVVVADAGFAVIDGVTDRNGTRYRGMLSGQFASRTVKRATEQLLLRDATTRFAGAKAFIDTLNGELRQGYVAEGALEAVEADWKRRAGCTIVAAICAGDRLEVVAVGDSGIRINGSELLQVFKPLDDVTAILRRESWRHFEARGVPADECEVLAGLLTWRGTLHQPPDAVTAVPATLAAIEAAALAACRRHLPQVPHSELLELIQHGIEHGQGNFQNEGDRVLGYGGLDGFPVPARFIEHRSYPLAEIHTLELFSDGYFEPAEEFGTAAWEQSFQAVEAADPHKIGRYLSTKGTTAAQLTDDRTYLGVRLR